jgi:hypothetical protein
MTAAGFCDCGYPVSRQTSTLGSVGLSDTPPPADVPGQSGGVPGQYQPRAVMTTQQQTQLPFRLGIDEKIWRIYDVARLPRRRGTGTLFVTDSRLVFYAHAKGRGTLRPSQLVQQTRLKDITGVAAYVTRRYSLLLVMATVFFGIAGLGSLFASPAGGFVFLAIAALGVVLLARGGAKRGATGVAISSQSSESSPIDFGYSTERNAYGFFMTMWRPLFNLLGVYTAEDVLFGRPGEHSDQVVHELGALILDLQTRGVHAAPHWGVELGTL